MVVVPEPAIKDLGRSWRSVKWPPPGFEPGTNGRRVGHDSDPRDAGRTRCAPDQPLDAKRGQWRPARSRIDELEMPRSSGASMRSSLSAGTTSLCPSWRGSLSRCRSASASTGPAHARALLERPSAHTALPARPCTCAGPLHTGKLPFSATSPRTGTTRRWTGERRRTTRRDGASWAALGWS